MHITPDQAAEIAATRNQSAPTGRATVPALEAMLYEAVPLLDHGFVRVIDYMGDDAAIVQAARVSYGRGTRRVSEDAGLIRYLMRHRHSTPFEMCEIKYHVKLPIFVARQWIRHRTACLAGDVRLTFDLPGGVERRGCQAYSMTVQQVFDKFQPTQNVTRPDKQRNPLWKRNRVSGMLLRSCDEDTLTLYHTSIVDIWQCGVKPIIRVDFGSNRVLRATKDHMCFTNMGWQSLEDALSNGALFSTSGRNCEYQSFVPEITDDDLATEEWRVIPSNDKYEVSSLGRVRSLFNTHGNRHPNPVLKELTLSAADYRVVSLSRDSKSLARLVHHLVLEAFSSEPRSDRETLHADHNRSNNRLTNLSYGTKIENAAQRMQNGADQRLQVGFIAPLSYADDGEEMTFDLEVEGPYHNFCAGGVYVHNSINEYSARYSILDREFYIPAPEQLAAQSTTNRQGRGAVLVGDEAAHVMALLQEDADRCYENYADMLNEGPGGELINPSRQGLARELARMNLTLNTYTQWYWKTDLHNLFNFLSLRADAHAQYEIRVYAEAMLKSVEAWVPLAFKAFCDCRLGAVTLTAGMLVAVQRMLSGEGTDEISSGLSRREWVELMGALGRSV